MARPKYNVKRFYFIPLVLLVILFICYQWSIGSSSTADQTFVLFTITPGESASQVGKNLEAAGFVSSSRLFDFFVWWHRQGASLQAGDHYLSRDMSLRKIVAALTEPSVVKENTITIIEGWSNQEIADYLATRGIVSKDDFLLALNQDYDYAWLPPRTNADYLEGYLFPDTYRIFATATAEDIVIKMLDNFAVKVVAELQSALAEKNLSWAEVVTLASIVEKEVSLPVDRRLVADLFWRRLQDNYPLQSDATVNFVTNKGLIQPSLADTQVDSLYNTYQNIGLPPGPICNPGLASLEAVVYPLSNTYYFFLTTKSDGQVIYSHTYEEHLQNKAKYLD